MSEVESTLKFDNLLYFVQSPSRKKSENLKEKNLFRFLSKFSQACIFLTTIEAKYLAQGVSDSGGLNSQSSGPESFPINGPHAQAFHPGFMSFE